MPSHWKKYWVKYKLCIKLKNSDIVTTFYVLVGLLSCILDNAEDKLALLSVHLHLHVSVLWEYCEGRTIIFLTHIASWQTTDTLCMYVCVCVCVYHSWSWMERGWRCPVWRASLFVTSATGVEAADSGRVWGTNPARPLGKTASLNHKNAICQTELSITHA